MADFKRARDIFDLLDHMAGADLSLPERAVLVQQYKYADKDGRTSYVSEKRLADDLFTTDKNIRNHRRKLRIKGWLIERERGKNTRDGDRASVYDVVIPLFQKPATRARRKANNASGWNQHRKNPSCNSQEDLTSNPSSREEEFFHLSTDLETDAVRRASDNAVVAGDDADVQSGSPAAPGSGPGSADGGGRLASTVAGADQGSASISKANDFHREVPVYEDPWGEAPKAQPHRHDELRNDLPAGAA